MMESDMVKPFLPVWPVAKPNGGEALVAEGRIRVLHVHDIRETMHITKTLEDALGLLVLIEMLSRNDAVHLVVEEDHVEAVAVCDQIGAEGRISGIGGVENGVVHGDSPFGFEMVRRRWLSATPEGVSPGDQPGTRQAERRRRDCARD